MGRAGVGVGRKVAGPAAVAMSSEPLGRKDVGDGRQTVGGLGGGDVMDVSGVGEVGGLVGDVAGQGDGVMATGEGGMERGRLDDPLVRKLLVRRRDDGEARRWFPSGRGRLEPTEGMSVAGLGRRRRRRRLSLARLGRSLEARLDDVTLLIADGDAPLQLLAHGGIVGGEARGETGQSDVVHDQATAVPRRRQGVGRRAAGQGLIGHGPFGEVELSRSMA